MKYILSYQLFEKKKFVKPKEATPQELKKRWDKKRDSIKELQKNISKLRNKVNFYNGDKKLNNINVVFEQIRELKNKLRNGNN